MSLRNQILNYISLAGEIHGGELEKRGMEWGYKASNISRRCRELENDGKLERIDCVCTKPKHVKYRIKREPVQTVLFRRTY